jgi:hypothetical protein
MAISKTKSTPKSKLILVALLVVLIAIAGYVTYSHYHKSGNIIPSKTSGSTAKPSSKSSSTSSSSTTASQPSSAKSSPPPAPASGAGPIQPTGPFVSNNTPGQNGAPTTEVSVCNTTPGASCYIEFTNGGITKKLTSQTTDSNGAAGWSWDIKDAGLTSGSWKITAIASYNGQSSSASDPVNLEVQ